MNEEDLDFREMIPIGDIIIGKADY